MIAFAKKDGDDAVIVTCNLDPNQAVETDVYLDLGWLGVPGDSVQLHDELTGATFILGRAQFRPAQPGEPGAHPARTRALKAHR